MLSLQDDLPQRYRWARFAIIGPLLATRIQLGLQPRNGGWLPTVGAGVQEIRIAYSKEAYRVIYAVALADCIYAPHAFHKKSKTRIATPITRSRTEAADSPRQDAVAGILSRWPH